MTFGSMPGFWKVGAKWLDSEKTQDRTNTNYNLAAGAANRVHAGRFQPRGPATVELHARTVSFRSDDQFAQHAQLLRLEPGALCVRSRVDPERFEQCRLRRQ